MADKKCAVGLADYVQLHSLSSFVLNDTSSKKLKRGKFYNVQAVKDKTRKILWQFRFRQDVTGGSLFHVWHM